MISVFSLVDTSTASSNIKESCSKVNDMSVLCFVLDCFGVESCFMFSETAFVHPPYMLIYLKVTQQTCCSVKGELARFIYNPM